MQANLGRKSVRRLFENMILLGDRGVEVEDLRADPRSWDSYAGAWACQSAEHDTDHGEAKEGDDGACVALEVARQASIAADPGEAALDNPALGQDDEAMGLAALDDLQGPATDVGHGLGHLGTLIAGIGEDALEGGKQTPSLAQHLGGAVAILNVGGVNHNAQQQAKRIDEDVALAAGDLLARVIPLRVEREAPF